jgi:hypothetical protein
MTDPVDKAPQATEPGDEEAILYEHFVEHYGYSSRTSDLDGFSD